jgi:hypothetical protein
MNKFYMDDVHWKLPQLFYFYNLGYSIWDTPILDPDLGPRFGTPPFWTLIYDLDLGPRFGTLIWDPAFGTLI